MIFTSYADKKLLFIDTFKCHFNFKQKPNLMISETVTVQLSMAFSLALASKF